MQHGLITGTNVFAKHPRGGGADIFMLLAGAPVDQQCTRSFFVVGVPSHGSGDLQSQSVSEKLQGLHGYVEKLLAEDEPILNTMRFKPGVMVDSDRHLSRYFEYVSQFPKDAPPAGLHTRDSAPALHRLTIQAP